MSVSNQLESEIELIISLPAASFDLAVSSLSKHLGVSQQKAAKQLRSHRLVMPIGDSGRRLKTVLLALGATMSAAKDARFAACIRAHQVTDFAIQTVASLLSRAAPAVALELHNPLGMILSDLPKAEVDRLQAALSRFPGISLTVVESACARVDIFASAAIPPRSARELSRYMTQRGLQPCRISGALMCDLNPLDSATLISRFADCGLIALPRAFQRFDLFVTGIGSLSASEATDFLQMRGNQTGWMAESVSALAPLRVETGLSRAAAVAFCADYTAIGLEVALRLVSRNS